MAYIKIFPIKSTVKKAVAYITNPDKTDEQKLVSSFGCSPETADLEFAMTAEMGKNNVMEKGDNLAWHMIISYHPNDLTDPKLAHEVSTKIADSVLKGKYEYVLTTHTDKKHIHSHLIFNATSFTDYHKYVSNKRTYYGIRNISDRLCRENGLSVVVPEKGSKGKNYAAYHKEKSAKAKLKIAVDTLIPQVNSFEELLSRLQGLGYEIKRGKYVSCLVPGQERFTRLKTIGADYTE